MHITNVYTAVSPILFITALFGLSSIFIINQNGIRKLKIYNIFKILNIIYISLFSFSIYSALTDVRTRPLETHYASGVSKIGIIFQLISQILLAYILYAVNITKSPKVLSCLEDVQKIDLMFQDLGKQMNYYNHFVYETIVILVGIVTILGRGLITHTYMSKSIFSADSKPHIVLSFPSLISFLIENNFVLLIKLLHERFSLVNQLLNNLIVEKIKNVSKIKIAQEFYLKHGLKRIELIMEIHDSLTDLGNKINDTFTVQILVCLGAHFLTEVFTVFYLYYESLIIKNKIAALIWSMWTISTTLEIFAITITCHLTCKKAQNTGIVIHKVLMTENEPCMKRKLMIFSQQVSNRPLQFTACGLFSLDATLIFTIAGAAATYLLIMLQFQEGIEAQCSNTTIHS